ncbi:MAG: fibronectin type III domain-containing protein [Chitinophagaceae bacterium]|nr:fibronectin type III domain-containing protein [Chitinophagaceae bacterium]
MKKLLTFAAILLVGLTQAFGSIITVSGYITTNQTWTSNNTYRLSGFVYVNNNATLTIQPGTLILGEKSTKGTLIITRGAKLIADGLPCQPIVFTSEQPVGSRTYGDWGGIIILGKASINQPGGEAIIEGGVDDGDGNATYGGGLTPDDNDNSGILRYVRIEFPGIAFQPNNEINGLTMGGVGAGTTVDYVQVSYSGDDSYEWFGGTVNCKHLIAIRALDDDFDTDNGFRGKIQYGVTLRDPNVADVSGSNGFESDNDATGTTNTPGTLPVFSNMTILGPLATLASTFNANFKRGEHVRRNSSCSVYNSLIMGWPVGLLIDGTSTEANASANTLQFQNNYLAGNTTNLAVNAGSTFDINSYFTSQGGNATYVNNSSINLVDAFNLTNPNFLPQSGSPALSGASFSNARLTDPFFTSGSFVGAFGATDWTKIWANFDPNNTTYSGAINLAPTLTSVITKSSCPSTGAVDLSVSGGVAPFAYLWSNGATTQDISGLAPATYTVTVSSGSCSKSASYVVASANIPKPTGVTINNKTACSMELSWNAVSVASGYKLRYRLTGTTTWTNISGTITALTYKFTGLIPNTSYDLSVATLCPGGTKSSYVNKTDNTTNGCAQPLNATAGNITSSTAKISWTGTCNAPTYNLQYRKTTTITWTSVNTAATNATISGLLANTSYDFRVRSECGGGNNSAYTAIQTFTTSLRLGMEAEELAIKGVNIYPNPAKDNVSIEITSGTSKIINITLVNSLGQMVDRMDNITVDGTFTRTIDLQKMNSGIYYVNIYDGKDVLSHQLVITK